jgi:hypothetical protein
VLEDVVCVYLVGVVVWEWERAGHIRYHVGRDARPVVGEINSDETGSFNRATAQV